MFPSSSFKLLIFSILNVCVSASLLSSGGTVHLSKDLSLSVPFGDPVALRFDKTAHYSLESDDGRAEFNALIPPGGHTVTLPDPSGEQVTYTVTLFHQLKCLGIIRDNYEARQPPSLLTRHCMNYLRQSVMCHMNLRIEPSVKPAGNAIRGYDAVCRDWTKLYEEVDKIHRAEESV
ncbi:hypothetical protein HYDPIDRAFT_111610 [Hydnomerulius pinastri MD-312]|uniref:Uncharacterized protein n=1 Tax=Hydnomerulius pinastri MD-312 TaxID=994086 RepID=A0A0C9WFL0_9AGAM|nr:hypothetical protein HYDPIDRAFT_111610 [Hydnomerulius pinastri MD-312]